MTEDTLTNGLKALFGTSAQQSAPASSSLIPYMSSVGEPVGLTSMANLVSVLGVPEVIEDTEVTDLNNLLGSKRGTTIYFCALSNAPLNLPQSISTSTRFFVEVIQYNGQYDIIQRCTSRGSSATYQRYRTGTTWNEWNEL